MSREGYGNEVIGELYKRLLPVERQKVFVFSRRLKGEEIREKINPAYYDLTFLQSYSSVYQAVQQLAETNPLPISIEFGLNLLHQYF